VCLTAFSCTPGPDPLSEVQQQISQSFEKTPFLFFPWVSKPFNPKVINGQGLFLLKKQLPKLYPSPYFNYINNKVFLLMKYPLNCDQFHTRVILKEMPKVACPELKIDLDMPPTGSDAPNYLDWKELRRGRMKHFTL
jgi:hypothetical protein